MAFAGDGEKRRLSLRDVSGFQGDGAGGGVGGTSHTVVSVCGVHDRHEAAEHDDEHGDRHRRLDCHSPALDSEERGNQRPRRQPARHLVATGVQRRKGPSLRLEIRNSWGDFQPLWSAAHPDSSECTG